MIKKYYRLLTIAGSDSSGGAGIQADLKTFAALGCYGMSVITALTAQNTVGVTGIYAVPPEFIAKQIDAVLSDIGADAVKIGMLGTAEVTETVASKLKAHGVLTVVVDPVMVAKSGDKLLQDNAVTALRTKLFPLATLITPNLPEAGVLLNRAVETRKEMEQAARDLQKLGPKAVLVKGGHAEGNESPDCLITEDGAIHWLEGTRINTPNTHGTGCTLSSAIAAYLGKGASVADAVRQAKKYISEAIRAGKEYKLGSGHGPVHHFHALWPENTGN
ncbi:MAG: bifunctional hydroxymethylpyrimidine kinase/phosphomethylpyrimidine kinase [Chlorobiales bacterium]|nr:bifunctional hydroxymethylpyrimidine kinase/phosphomethylpyrimidine kinase [Chlorobiales bacterium]